MHNQKHFPSWLRMMKCLVCTVGKLPAGTRGSFPAPYCLPVGQVSCAPEAEHSNSHGAVSDAVALSGVCPQLCLSPFLYSMPFTSTMRSWTWDRSTGFGMPVITRSAACALRSSLRSGARIWMLLPLLWSVDVSSRSSWKRYSGKLKSAPAVGSAIAAGVGGRAALSWKKHHPIG